VAQKTKHTPGRPVQAQNSGRSGLSAFWLEILFFVALAAFGFSSVTYILNARDGGVLTLATGVVPEAQPVTSFEFGPFEARSLRPVPELSLSPIFTPSVQYWREDILGWAREYSLDPNLIATVMQIESCGYPLAGSIVGAQGLFQVMPYHFEEGEEILDPDTNALRGMAYLSRGLELSGGHAGLALAGYNGGHAVINREYDTWANETQRYYRWGSGIYREASSGWDSSPTLQDWLKAGGASLCSKAEEYLGLASASAPGS